MMALLGGVLPLDFRKPHPDYSSRRVVTTVTTNTHVHSLKIKYSALLPAHLAVLPPLDVAQGLKLIYTLWALPCGAGGAVLLCCLSSLSDRDHMAPTARTNSEVIPPCADWDELLTLGFIRSGRQGHQHLHDFWDAESRAGRLNEVVFQPHGSDIIEIGFCFLSCGGSA